MNEIREVAMAYYANATSEDKELANQLFGSLDVDGDGRVSLAEYNNVLGPELSEQFFWELDVNGDGTLDFSEVLAIYYLYKCKIRNCDSCANLLLGSYFSCLLCEKDVPQSYDLCCSCYGGGRGLHHHSPAYFMDNRSMRLLLSQFLKGAEISKANPDETTKQNAKQLAFGLRSRSKLEKARKIFEILSIGNTAINIGQQAVAIGCAIM